MKTKKIIPGLCIVFFSFTVFAQEEDRALILKYDLISLLGDQVTNSMGIMLGAEYFIKSNKSMVVDAMYIFPCATCGRPYTSITAENTYGFSISAENRFYLIPGNKVFTGFHLGPQVLFQHTMSEMRETYDGGFENLYQVYRNLLAAHVLAGYQLRITGPLFFNPAIGLGVRVISSRNENRKGVDSGQHEYPYDKDFESGKKLFPSLIFNLKIGIKL